jgi:transposase
METLITYVGLDVHKETISVAVAESGDRGQARYFGKIANDAQALSRLAAKLSRKGRTLRFCYEAGPCGYAVHRHLTGLGHDCAVVAPSLIPRRPGDRVKTDRRDCLGLCKLDRAGELTAVWVPDAEHEAMRDLVRARGAAVKALRRARQQLSGFLLRHGRVRTGKNWTLAHRRWLATLRFEHFRRSTARSTTLRPLRGSGNGAVGLASHRQRNMGLSRNRQHRPSTSSRRRHGYRRPRW